MMIRIFVQRGFVKMGLHLPKLILIVQDFFLHVKKVVVEYKSVLIIIMQQILLVFQYSKATNVQQMDINVFFEWLVKMLVLLMVVHLISISILMSGLKTNVIQNLVKLHQFH
ncbi:unnamed protein product [Paramecium octaurelia]|uniref:Transmembrane protein n=1 Tax=Paramecium octaurelia TaxID=43137 RepID=A0A8S1YH65_PAROT|nr:unnamed protein product [Paramecium octaurelia]